MSDYIRSSADKDLPDRAKHCGFQMHVLVSVKIKINLRMHFFIPGRHSIGRTFRHAIGSVPPGILVPRAEPRP